MSADLAGGPAGWIDGTIWLTRERFAFRPAQEPSHFWAVTVSRSDLGEIRLNASSNPPRLGLTFRALRGAIPCEVEVANAEAWVELARELPEPVAGDARDRLSEALARQERDTTRYVALLLDLSFPRGDWHVELIEDMRDVCGARLAQLGIEEKESFWTEAEAIARRAEAKGRETGRGEQIAQICHAVGTVNNRCFRRYAPLPDWPHGEPVWLWLSDDEDRRLRELGVIAVA